MRKYIQILLLFLMLIPIISCEMEPIYGDLTLTIDNHMPWELTELSIEKESKIILSGAQIDSFCSHEYSLDNRGKYTVSGTYSNSLIIFEEVDFSEVEEKLIILCEGVGSPYLENFETGTISPDWIVEGEASGTIDNVAFSGNYSMKLEEINGESPKMKIILEILQDGYISFDRKVSTSPNFGNFLVFIDDTLMDSWNGEQDWEREWYPIDEGTHSITWRYYDNGVVIGAGSKAAWIDNIWISNYRW